MNDLRKKTMRRSGFTLVELVIVIAVLAILSGVGSVAYRGYIKRANEANDLALLSAVNTAFQSACMEKGMSAYPSDAKAPLNDDGAVEVSEVAATKPEVIPLSNEFGKFFKKNEDKRFKIYKELGYVGQGMFAMKASDGTIALANGWKMKAESNPDGTTTYTVTDPDTGKESTYTVSDDSVETFNDSVFGKEMTVGQLMDEIGACADGAGGTFAALGAQNLMSGEALEKFNEYISKNNIQKGTKEYDDAVANAVVMNLAGLSKDMTVDEAIKVIKNESSLGTKPGERIVTRAATSYAVLTAWAHDPEYKDKKVYGDYTAEAYWNYLSEGLRDEEQLPTIKGEISQLGNRITSTDNFDEYVKSESGRKSIEAYVGAMGTVSGNEKTLEDNDIYKNGFTDEDLNAVLNGVYGGK